MEPRLQVPEFLPGGQSLLVDNDFYQRLHYGDASIGWLGDERLGVYYNGGRLEIHRHCEDGEVRLIMRGRPGMSILDTQALRFLAEHDSRARNYENVADNHMKHNQAIFDARQDAADEKVREAAEHLHHSLLKDIGHLEGGSTRKFL